MDDALNWRLPFRRRDETSEQARTGATARFGGDNDKPVLVAVVHGPVQIEMARDALAENNIPALVKQPSIGPIYGLTVGSFGSAEVWVPPALAEAARDVLISIGVMDVSDEDSSESSS
jgi:hypothetical protein